MQEIQALSIKDVAQKLSVSERHVARLIAKNDIPSVRIGRRRVIRKEALVAWLKGQEGKAP